jgi:prephenate dehydratase
VKVGYLGPEGTHTHEALIAGGGADHEMVALPTIYDTVMAVHEGTVHRSLVPIENSLEGSVNATLDAIAIETEDVAIVGELVHPIRTCLIARAPLELTAITKVVSHQQANAQCARFLRTRLAGVPVLSAASTADAVRMVAQESDPTWAALGNRVAAERYACEILRAGVDDVADNETRFVWLARPDDGAATAATHGPFKTAAVFWGVGSEAPGWLVRCLSELSSRDVNMTRIESRPRKQGLGRYMFFVDVEGRDTEPHVADALAALARHVERLRVLGSFPAAF